MSQYIPLALIVVAFLVFGGIGTAVGQRYDQSGRTRSADVTFGVLFGGGGAVLVGVVLYYLGFW